MSEDVHGQRRRWGPNPALPAWLYRGLLRREFLACYNADEAFRASLPELLEAGDDEANVAAFARRYGLDRLTGDRIHPSGVVILGRWVHRGRADQPLFAAAFGGYPADLATAGFERLVEPTVVDQIAWDPTKEPRAAARRRLVAQVDALLTRGEQRVLDHGYVIRDSEPRVLKHVEWTYQWVRGRTYAEIAQAASADPPVQPGGVRLAVRRMAERIGLASA